MNYDDIELINNEAIHNFELFVDGQRAFIDYKTKDNKIYLIHTEVPKELQGRGVAEAIVEKAFHYIEAHKLVLIPLCSYVQVFLRKHPEWDRLLAA
ncbi:N-acetyltransferase [Mucilaginibacter sp. ZT4R22]|uniref:N-acetyltransferase n=1 Tax=Mucilaginibacter pankratovii TaxID=2772110 RepID=A0ABR7WJG2_9SPHI|nr:GNAT family N-acetyltransferase [Mucilaginibacter pankratovii]MBD1362301.1 N-acetyltransferase [Mucilaginibacter pankratovii]